MARFINCFALVLVYFKDFDSGILRPRGGEGIQCMVILLGCAFVWELVHNIHLILIKGS